MLGREICFVLPGMHALTGCDTTSCFVGKGKLSCFKKLLGNPNAATALGQLGVAFTLGDERKQLEEFVCHMYGTDSTLVNEARYNLFCSTAPVERSLPPTQDALLQHMRRCAYQTKIWRSALDPMMNVPSHSWTWMGNHRK